MGQQQSRRPLDSDYGCIAMPRKPTPKIEHEGVLKLRSTPFPNCVEIENDGVCQFLENAQITLKDLLSNRHYTNSLLPRQDIQRLFESVVYTLAHFEEMAVPYKQLSSNKIYYSNGVFKLLPNQLIDETSYSKALKYMQYCDKQPDENQFVLLSPELVIAMRYRETQINDLQILNKSNVFILGLIFLEACTMLPSWECFDPYTYDIYNNVITDRLEMVEENYDSSIVRMLGNMFDYDFSERMSMKDLAIWINRELALQEQNRGEEYLPEGPSQPKTVAPVRSHVTTSYNQNQMVLEPEKNRICHQAKVANNYGRSNSVYIKGYHEMNDPSHDESHPCTTGNKNSVYLKYQPKASEPEEEYQAKAPPSLSHQSQFQYKIRRQPEELVSHNLDRCYLDKKIDRNHQSNQYAYSPSFHDSILAKATIKETDYSLTPTLSDQLIPSYQPALDYQPTHPYQPAQPYRQGCSKMGSKEIKSGYNPYLNLKLDKQNDESASASTSKTKRLTLHSQVGKNRQQPEFNEKDSESRGSIKDGSINRIKMEIEKSRQLIQEFRKCEGIERY